MNVFAAQLKSDDFSLKLEFNKHSNPEEMNVSIGGSCRAGSILGATECGVRNTSVVTKYSNENLFLIPGFKLKTESDGMLISSYQTIASVHLSSKDSGTTLYRILSEKSNQDVTDVLRKYFDDTIFITTVPAFDFKYSGKLISTRVTSSKLKSSSIYLSSVTYSLLDENNKIINPLLCKTHVYTGAVCNQNNQDVGGIELYDKKIAEAGAVRSFFRENMIASKIKPSTLKVAINLNVNYFGKNKMITKNYIFNDLDNIDISSKIQEIEFEIVDEDID